MNHRHGLAWYLAAQLLILIVFYWPWLTGGSSFYFRDVTHYVEPFCRFVSDGYRHLRLPLWNPWMYCGIPQAAVTVQGIFYPPTWLFALLPFNSALASSMILHQLLCGLGGFLLISSWGWGLEAAIIGGVTLAMSGYMFSLVPNFTLVCTAAWCPLSFWAVQQIGDSENVSDWSPAGNPFRRTVHRTAIAALCIGMLFLAGHPELITITIAAICADVLYSAFRNRASSTVDWKQEIFGKARAIGLGVLIAMPVVLPGYEWLGLSRRSGGMLSEESLLLSSSWYDLLNLILPQPLGDLQLRYSPFRALIMPGQMVPYLGAAFVGPIVSSLAFTGFSDRTWRYRWLVLGLLILAILLTLGGNGPFVPFLLKLVPSLSFIRFPVKQLFFVVWCLSIAAARGLVSISKDTANPVVALLVWIGLFGLGIALLAQPQHLLIPVLSGAAVFQQSALQAQALVGQSLELWSGVGLLTAIGIFVISKRSQIKSSVAICLLLAAICTLLYYPINFCRSAAPGNYFEQPSFVAGELKRLRAEDGDNSSRIIGLYLEHFTVPPSYVGKDPVGATVRMYQYSRELLRPNTNIDFAEPSSFGFEGTVTGEYFFFVLNSYFKSSQALGQMQQAPNDEALARFCQFTSTHYVLTQASRFARGGTTVPIPVLDNRWFTLAVNDNDLNVRIYRVLGSLPRAYFSPSWKVAQTRDDAISALFEPDKSGFDPTKRTLLEHASGGDNLPESQTGESNSTGTMSAVSIVRDDYNNITLNVNAPAAGFVVLSDQYYPGWVADVDGKPAPIAVANGFTRAVPVSAGKHLVAFHYRPRSVLAGVLLFLLAVLWLAYLYFLSRDQRSK